MVITDEEMVELAEIIKKNIKQNFAQHHVTGNLMDTLQIEKTENGVQIHIPAEMYDENMWDIHHVIVYTGEGSYAQEVDITGGYSGTHKNYVENAIYNGINEFMIKHQKKGGIVEIL